jgi:flagellar assembly protein FliH
MFSSDPLGGLPASAPHRTVRPAILGADEVAAYESASLATAWMPDHMESAAFDFPELDATPLEPAPNARAVPRDPREQALNALREQARLEAEAALREALAEREADEAALREQLQQEAYAAGVAAGRAEAEAAVRDATASALQALWLATEEVRTAETRWLAALQDNIAALVAGAARHVVVREVTADDAFVRELAARAVAEFPQDHPLHVRVHPSDLATLKGAVAGWPRTGELRWTADPRVERGGCVVEGRERIVDGRVDMALERIYRRLSGHHA